MSERAESLCMATAMENPELPLNVTMEDLSTNREAWKFDKVCSLCGSTFGMLNLNHKYRCKFCYRGICEKCSTWRVLHPEFGVPRRCCQACYQKFISSTMREEMQGRLDESQAWVSRIERTITSVRDDRTDMGEHARKLQMDASRLMIEHSRLEGELEKVLGQRRDALLKLKNQKTAFEKMIKDKETQITEIKKQVKKRRNEIKSVEKLISEAQKLVSENKVLLSKSQDEEVELLRISATRKQSVEVAKGTAKELKVRLGELKGSIRVLEANIQQTKSQLKEVEEAIGYERKQGETPLPVEMVTRSPSVEQEDLERDVEKDKERYRELLEENYELRREYTEKQQNEEVETLTFIIKGERSKTAGQTKTPGSDSTTLRDPRHCGCVLF